jgi:hypothetical protein
MIATKKYYIIMTGLDESCTRTSLKSLQGRSLPYPVASKIFSYTGSVLNCSEDRLCISEFSQHSFISVINSTGFRFNHVKESAFPLVTGLMLDISLRVRFTSDVHATNMAVLKLLKSFGNVKTASLSSSKGINDWRLRVPPTYFPKGVEEGRQILQFEGIEITLDFEDELLSECSYDSLKLRGLEEVTLHEGPTAFFLQCSLRPREKSHLGANLLSIPSKCPLLSSGTTGPESQNENAKSQSSSKRPLRVGASKFNLPDLVSSSGSEEELPQAELHEQIRPKVVSMSTQQEAAKTNISELKRRIQIHAKTLEGSLIFQNIQNRIACKTSPDMDEAQRLLIEAKIMRSKIKRMKRKMKSKRKEKAQGAGEPLLSGHLSDEDEVGPRHNNGISWNLQPQVDVGLHWAESQCMPLHTGNLGATRGYPVGQGGLHVNRDFY